jgi:protocatechuate 3,4-dioxygenase, beta subunit
MRRPFLPLVTLFVTTTTLAAQDVEFIRALERAQQQRPATLATSARIAPASEPGTPLVIQGRVFNTDGTTPLGNAVVFAYHTDREGLYDRQGAPAHSWRLRGWAKTDAEGRFEFRTMRPGSYPNSRNPAHVHLTVFTPEGARYHAGEVQFADDPVLPASARESSEREGQFGSVRTVRTESGTQHVDCSLRLQARNKF